MMNKNPFTIYLLLIVSMAIVAIVIDYTSFGALNTSGNDPSEKWLSISVKPSAAVVKQGEDFALHSYARILGGQEPGNVSIAVGFVVTWNWTEGSEALGSLRHGIFKGMRYAEIHAEKTGVAGLEGTYRYFDSETDQQFLNKTYIQVTVVR